MRDGTMLNVSDGSGTLKTETATWVRWTKDGKLQQRWWVQEDTADARRGYEEWRDVPTVQAPA